jgi:hypothetical protein
MLRKIWMLLFLSANNMAVAADNFDISTNVLTAPQVRVADTLYFDVQLKVTSVVSVGNSVVTETYDTYNAQNNQLSIPVVTVGSATYYNAIVKVGSKGHLDACNGRFGVTPESPTTTVYHYFITDSYPFVPRCVFGAPATWGNDGSVN